MVKDKQQPKFISRMTMEFSQAFQEQTEGIGAIISEKR